MGWSAKALDAGDPANGQAGLDKTTSTKPYYALVQFEPVVVGYQRQFC